MRVLMAALLLGGASPAFADAAASFNAGKWAQATKEGRAEATPDSLVLAGRAVLTQAGYGTSDKRQALAMVVEAEGDFDAALVKAPADPGALFQKAVAIGYRAKLTKSPGLGKDCRVRFEAWRAAHPQMAEGWAAVAGWNAGAISTLGSFMAKAVLGAKPAEVEPGFAKARALAPTNPVHRTVYALAMMDLDKGNAAKAAAVLQGVGQLPARDGYEALMRAQGVQLAAALKAGDAKAAQVLARRLQAFGGL
ncbi:hypothetical protein GCM10011529_26040 [Polymorphobacter glacialis]|uniref:Tetratricopeptide repeat protein n=1 Tax=Sandarakinorhabdus glacialis TaxID=1614636 RepID=A0A916ZZ05_9SPHN|nr:hypothetical protein [Polymorphobacter glacialis]GGE18394.1 hypothetical protein GCM10011529_26040 [Polymorphobacter glacialis]